MDEALKKAREYEAKHKHFADEERQAFHITPMVGWMNDPNGFSIYKGEYHLFYQYYPYATHWGPTHWGHVKTKDFIKWDYLPCALAPQYDYESNGCFSGSAIELEDGRQLLIYTGGFKGVDEKGRPEQDLQHQCVAIGDGIDFEKVENNPVLSVHDVPPGGNWLDFRDPKIIKEDDGYVLLVTNRPDDGSGRILVYKGKDGINWDYEGILIECHNEYGRIWECPDFFLLDGKWVFLGSPQEMLNDGLEFHPGYGTLAIMGEFDKPNLKFTRENLHAIDYGTDFYAPQTLVTEDGRRIMIAWLMNWTNSGFQNPYIHYFSSMTLPRELHVRNNRLCQEPVRELDNYRVSSAIHKNIHVKEEVSFDDVKGRYIDMLVHVTPLPGEKGSDCFEIQLAKDDMFHTSILYKAQKQTVTVDRKDSGVRFDTVQRRKFYVRDRGGEIDLRIIVDKDSLEIFVNDGEQTFTGVIYTDISAEQISFRSISEVSVDIECHQIRVEQ